MLQGVIRCYTVLQGVTLLQGVSQFYTVFLGVLHDITWFYKVLQVITACKYR